MSLFRSGVLRILNKLSLYGGVEIGFSGLNGAGKTTTIKMLLAMLKPTSVYLFRLPSDSTSRWTTLSLANVRRSPASVRDFHPRDDAHAGRTNKKATSLLASRF
ncbi:ATP-binding cassette domain-containing protein [Paenibacillus sp. FSL H7-0357]|uniref:ATP-binding cassette domain-containing protein n=1 Tax=Paenibacillus sp. FSL H7-0357 TaxID=1536774 RepID=UPI0009DD95A6